MKTLITLGLAAATATSAFAAPGNIEDYDLVQKMKFSATMIFEGDSDDSGDVKGKYYQETETASITLKDIVKSKGFPAKSKFYLVNDYDEEPMVVGADSDGDILGDAIEFDYAEGVVGYKGKWNDDEDTVSVKGTWTALIDFSFDTADFEVEAIAQVQEEYSESEKGDKGMFKTSTKAKSIVGEGLVVDEDAVITKAKLSFKGSYKYEDMDV